MNLKSYSKAFLFLILILSASCRGPKKDTTDYSWLYRDPPKNKQFPAGIIEIEYISSGSKIYGFEYLASGAGPHPSVVLVHANPGNERNLDIAQALRRAGYNVFYFDYRGSWGSEGVYTYANCIADTRAVIDYIVSPKNVDRLRVDPEKLFMIGHNLGAGIGIIEALNDNRIKAVAAISLVNPYTMFKGVEARYNLMDMQEYFSTLGMLNVNPDGFLKGIARNVDKYNIEAMVARTSKPVLVLDEHHNNEFLQKYNPRKNIQYQIWDTDLEFSDARITLTKKLKVWLDSCQVSENR